MRVVVLILFSVFLPMSVVAQSPTETPQALYEAGMTYARATPPNYSEAMKLLRDAADKGFAKAQATLGEFYQGGLGVEKNGKEAIQWFVKAANQGDLRAQTQLANMYANGLGVKADDKEALKWLRKAAEQGMPSAQTMLGVFYSQGRAVERNPTTAMEWYQKAVSQNFPTAQFAIGAAYENGFGGFEMSLDAAASWYGKAAAQGLEAAKAALRKIEPDIAGSPTTLQMGGEIARTHLVSQQRPRYPEAAKARRIADSVTMDAMISTTGRIRSLKITHGHPLLNEAAMTAVSQWRYTPQTSNGQPAQVLTVVTINFDIQ